MSGHRCPHGLDLRKHARCYLCEPEPRPIVIPGSLPSFDWYSPPCTCPRGNYTGDVLCERHRPTNTTTFS